MQLDQNKSVGLPALFEGKDRFKDDHVSISVDALSNTFAADSSGQIYIGFHFNVVSCGFCVWECCGILCDQFST